MSVNDPYPDKIEPEYEDEEDWELDVDDDEDEWEPDEDWDEEDDEEWNELVDDVDSRFRDPDLTYVINDEDI